MTKPPNLSHPERQFGCVVGGVLLALGLWTLWRRSWPLPLSATLASIGLLLVVLGLAYPRALVRPRQAWMALAEALNFVSTRVILAVVFFVGILPAGFVMRLFGWDPLGRQRSAGGSYWVDYPPRQQNPKYFEQMF